MLKVPESITVSGHELSIFIEENPMSEKGDLLWGYFDADEMKIVIREDATKSKKTFEEVLFHEMLHALIEFSGLSHLMSHESNEAIVRCLDYGLRKHIKIKYD